MKNNCKVCDFPEEQTLHGWPDKCLGCKAPQDHHKFVEMTDEEQAAREADLLATYDEWGTEEQLRKAELRDAAISGGYYGNGDRI